MRLNTKLHDTDFGRTSLEPALKGQYEFLIVNNQRFAIMEQYKKNEHNIVFLVLLLRVAWSICT